MRAGILPQFHPNQQQTNNTDVPRPEAPLGTDGKFLIQILRSKSATNSYRDFRFDGDYEK